MALLKTYLQSLGRSGDGLFNAFLLCVAILGGQGLIALMALFFDVFVVHKYLMEDRAAQPDYWRRRDVLASRASVGFYDGITNVVLFVIVLASLSGFVWVGHWAGALAYRPDQSWMVMIYYACCITPAWVALNQLNNTSFKGRDLAGRPLVLTH